MKIKKTCVLCSKSFFTSQTKAKFCGPVCYREGMRRLNRARNRNPEYRRKVIYPATKKWMGKRV